MSDKFQHKPNSGTLFQNDRKESETHADRTGDSLIECPHCHAQFEAWLNGWIKTTKAGKQFLSLSIKPKSDKRQSTPQKPYTSNRAGDGF